MADDKELVGLQLSSDEIRAFTNWDDAMIEDYMSLVEKLNDSAEEGDWEEALETLQALIDEHIANTGNPHAVKLNQLLDVEFTSLGYHDILAYVNGNWVNTPLGNLIDACCKDLIIIAGSDYDGIYSGKTWIEIGLREYQTVGGVYTAIDTVGLEIVRLEDQGFDGVNITSDAVSFSLGASFGSGNIFWSADGLKFWNRITGTSTQLKFQSHNVSTAWDLDTYTSSDPIVTLPAVTGSGSNLGLFWISKDGLTLVSQGYDDLYQYDTTSANDFSIATYTKTKTNIVQQLPRTYGMALDNATAYIWYWASGTSMLYKYNINDDNDVDLVSFSQSFDYETIEIWNAHIPRGIMPSADGMKLFLLTDDNFTTRHLLDYDLPASFDISSMVLASDLAGVFTYTTQGGWLSWSANGDKVYDTVGGSTDNVSQYSSQASGGGVTTYLYHDDDKRVTTTAEGADVNGVLRVAGANSQIVLPSWPTVSLPTPYNGALVYDATVLRPSWHDGSGWKLVSTKAEHDQLRIEFDVLEGEHDALRIEYDAHVAGTADKHPAADITFDDTQIGHGLAQVQEAVDYLHGEILQREPLFTGLVTGGYPIVLNGADPTHSIDVPVGTGRVINTYTNRPDPEGFDIAWLVDTIDLTSYFISPNGVVTIYVTPNLGDLSDSTVNVIQGIASTTLYRGNVILGHVFYHDGEIDQILNSPIQVNEVGGTLYDFVEYNTPEELTRGVLVGAVTGALSVWLSSGTIFHIGSNVIAADPLNPNILAFPALGDDTTPVSFDVYLQDGTEYLSGQTVLPEFYEDPLGVPVALTGSKATIHYVFRSASGHLMVQLGQNLYPSGKEARDSVSLDASAHVYMEGSDSVLFRAQIYMERNTADFSDSTKAGIVNFGAGGGGGGGGGVAVSNFIDLTDVLLGSYAGYGDYVLTVNGAETGVVATDLSLVYEPIFAKNTGFNLNLGTSAGTVSEGDHLHTGVYEPADATILKDADIGVTVEAYVAKLTAWNKNFGTIAGTVAEGNHVHSWLDLSDTPVTFGTAGQAVVVNGAGNGLEFTTIVTSVAWGDITGTLSNQTDLQAALDAKVDKAGDTMTGQLKGITPSSPEDLTRKDYTDKVAEDNAIAYAIALGG